MQLSRFALLALPALAIAVVIPGSKTDTCYSGALLCCGKMADPNNPEAGDTRDSSPSDNHQPTGKIYSNCFPIQIIVGGIENPCAAAEVCCVSYNPDQLIGYGCVEDFNA